MLKKHLKLFFVFLLIISIPDINFCRGKLIIADNKYNSKDFSQLDASGGNGSEPRLHTINSEKKNETQNHLQESSLISSRLNSTNSPVKGSRANVEIELHHIESKNASSEVALWSKNRPKELSSSFATGNSSNTSKVSNKRS